MPGMTKSCFGYKINHEIFCRPCGRDRLDKSMDAVFDIEDLHAESKDLSCEKCGASLGEPADE